MKKTVFIAAAAAIGLGVLIGDALGFTLFQTATMCLSLGQLVFFLADYFSGYLPQVLLPPLCRVVIFGLFLLLLGGSFFGNPSGGIGFCGLSDMESPDPGNFPRIVSMMIATMPGIPFGVKAVCEVFFGR